MRAHLVKDDAVARQAVDIVEIRIRVEVSVSLLDESAATPLVSAGLSHEFYLDGPLAETLRAGRGGGDGHLFDRVGSRIHHRVEGAARAVLEQVVLYVDAIQRHIHRGLRKPVEGGVARPRGRLRSGQRDNQIGRIAARNRQIVHLPSSQVAGHSSGGADYDFRSARHLDGFRDRPHLQAQVDGGRNAGVHLDAVFRGLLEAGSDHRHAVGGRGQRGYRPVSFIVRKRAKDLARQAVRHRDVSPPNECALGVRHETIHGAGVHLRECRREAEQQQKRSRLVHVYSFTHAIPGWRRLCTQ